MLITIYDRAGNPKAELSPNDSSTQAKAVQGDNVLTLSFTLYDHIALDVYDYADFEGERYWLTERYRPKQKSTREWAYDLKLYGIESLVKNWLVLKTVDNEQDPVFTLTAPPREHVAMIVKCMNDACGNITDWKVGQVNGTENITIDYFGKYCDEGLREIAGKVGAEFWTEGQTVNICRCEHGEPVTLGYGRGLLSIDPGTANNVKFYTRLFPKGSSRNIDPSKYGYSRLQLPGGQKYIEVYSDEYGIVDHYEESAFADIYPRRTGTVSSVRTETRKGQDGNPYDIYYFTDDNLPFNPDDYQMGRVIRVSFQEGSELAGQGEEDNGTYYFETNYDADTREFEIVTIWPYDNGLQLPGNRLIPKPGDRYILWNLRMPDEYYALAEEELLAAVNAFNREHTLDIAVFKAPTDHVWIEENGVELAIGRRVRLESEKYFPGTGYRDSRITRITRKVNLPSQMDIEIGDAVSRTFKASMADSIADVRGYARSIGESVALPDIIRTGDRTRPTDNNLFSARRTVSGFLSKLGDDRSAGRIASDKAFEVGDFLAGVSGARIGKDADTGQTSGEMDRLFVRVKAYFETLTVINSEALAGEQRITPGGGIKCTSVGENGLIGITKERPMLDEDGNPILDEEGNPVLEEYTELADNGIPAGVYRCYFLSEQDGEKTETKIIAGDQAIAQMFNAKTGTANKVSNHRYWRLVTAVSNDAYTDDSGNRYGYIDLSKEDCEKGSDIPQAGDTIVQFGNRTDRTRQAAMVFSTVDSDAPGIRLFTGIGSGTTSAEHYSLAGRDIVSYGYDSVKGHAYFRCYGDTYIGSPDGSTFVKYDRDADALDIKARLTILPSSTIGGKGLDDYFKDLIPEIRREDIEGFVNAIMDPRIEGIQGQIDGVIESFFGFGAPTLNNYPANEWTTDEARKAHERDTYTDKTEYVDDKTTPTAGQSWRWQYTSPTDYGWVKIADSDAVKALLDAAKAQDTANGKRRTFTDTPVPPYDDGDMWVNATYPAGNTVKDPANGKYSNDILRCNPGVHKASGAFDIRDWGLSSGYTDDTLASSAMDAADAAQKAADKARSEADAARERLDGWAQDGVISPAERQGVRDEVARIDADKAHIEDGYARYGLGAPAAYYLVHGGYRAVLARLGEPDPEPTPIPSNFAALQKSYYDRRTDALSAIAEAAKKHAEEVAEAAVADYRYLREAMVGGASQTIGGLFLSSYIKLGSWDKTNPDKPVFSTPWSGLNGVYADGRTPSYFAGGDMIDRFDALDNYLDVAGRRYATSMIRMDGSAYFADGKVGFRKDGSGWLGDTVKGISFSHDGSMTFGSGIMITTEDGDRSLRSLVNFMQGLGDVFVPEDGAGNRVEWNSAALSRVHVRKSLFSDGGITALGAGGGSGSGGPGGGASALADLLDVDISDPAGGHVLRYDGTHWRNVAGMATEDYVDSRIDALVNGAPAAFDTLKEIADVLQGNVGSIGDIMAALGTKADKAQLGDYVTLGTAQTVRGRKTFTEDILMSATTADGNGIRWERNTDWARVWFKNAGDGDTDSYLGFQTGDNGNEYFRFSHKTSGKDEAVWATVKAAGVTANAFIRAGGTSSQFLKADGSVTETSALDSRFVNASGDTMTGPLNVSQILDQSGANTLLAYKRQVTGAGTSQWAAGAPDCQGVIRSSAASLLHFRAGTGGGTSTIWDSGNDGDGSGLDADLLDGTHKSGLLTSLANAGSSVSLTVGGTTRTLTVGYASRAGALMDWGWRSFTKNDNGGRDTFLLIADCSPLWESSSNHGHYGFNGLATVTRNGGYPINNTVLVEAVVGYAKDRRQLRALGSERRVSPCVAVYGGRHYVALRLSGADFALRMAGIWQNALATPVQLDVPAGASLPEGVTLAADTQAYTMQGTALRWQTARRLWGQEADGSRDVSGDMSGVGSLSASGEIRTSSANAFRATNGSRGVFMRVDSTYAYLMLTGAGDPLGGWNSLRPLTVRLEDGRVALAGEAVVARHGGNVGIGTASPAYRLDVNGTARVTALRIGGATVSWDAANNALKIDGNVYAAGGVTALGSGGGSGSGGSGGGGSQFGLMREWPASDPGAATSEALGANLGWELRNRRRAASATDGGDALRSLGLALNPSGLADAAYGAWGGITQSSSGNAESGQWASRLKILHTNASSHHYTELAMSFTGTEGVYYRVMRGGTLGAWRRLAYASELSSYQPRGSYMTTDSAQTVGVQKTYTVEQRFSTGSFSDPAPGLVCAVKADGTVCGRRLVAAGGTASQFLMADGSTASKADAGAVSSLGWKSNGADALRVPTMNAIAYWNGRFNDSSSNLRYSANGEINRVLLQDGEAADAVAGEDKLHTSGRLVLQRVYARSGYPARYGSLLTMNTRGETQLFVAWNPSSAGIHYRTSSDNASYGGWTRVLDASNYASVLDSRYFTESESDARFVSLTKEQEVRGAKMFRMPYWHLQTESGGAGVAAYPSGKDGNALTVSVLGTDGGWAASAMRFRLDGHVGFTHAVLAKAVEGDDNEGLSLGVPALRSAIFVDYDGCVGVGGILSPGYPLDVRGTVRADNVLSKGGVTALSDMRLKTVLRPLGLSVRDIAAAPSFVYRWKDGGAGAAEQAGTSAQYWLRVLPQAVERGESLSLDYGKAALLSAIALAGRSDNHEGRINNHEERVRRLEAEIRTLVAALRSLAAK